MMAKSTQVLQVLEHIIMIMSEVIDIHNKFVLVYLCIYTLSS